jgi:hypothetical protein
MVQKLDLKPVLTAVNPEEAIAYFRQKDYRIGFDYRDVWQQEHQAGFTVAKAMQVDLLQDIRAAVDKALANGTTLATFQKELTPLLQKRGWWGKQEMADPTTGEIKLVQLGSPARLELIYDTNLAAAYSEGQWERIQRNKELFPFLEYVRSASVNPRHTHLAYAGLVLSVDDAFWSSHYPIKEFRCKCTVVQHTQRMLDQAGLKVGKAPPEVMRTVVNKRTGEVMQVPTGVHPAFHYPPGGRRAHLEKMLEGKQAEAGGVQAASASKERRASATAAATQMAGAKDANRMVHDFGPVPERAAHAISKLTGIDVSAASGYRMVMTGEAVKHVLASHGDPLIEAKRKPPQAAVTVEDFHHIAQIAEEFDDMLLGERKKHADAPAVMLRQHLPADGAGPAVQAYLVMQVRTNAKRPRVALKTYYKHLVPSKKTGD